MGVGGTGSPGSLGGGDFWWEIQNCEIYMEWEPHRFDQKYIAEESQIERIHILCQLILIPIQPVDRFYVPVVGGE